MYVFQNNPNGQTVHSYQSFVGIFQDTENNRKTVRVIEFNSFLVGSWKISCVSTNGD